MPSLPNILIVDDNSTNLIYLEIILRQMHAHLIQCSSGFEALEATRNIDLSMAILDVQMPIMNGYELAVRLNAERVDRKVPIIFLTAAYPNIEKVLEGYEAGAVDYIIKPLNKMILLSKINVFLEIFWQKQRVLEHSEKLRHSELELTQAKKQLELVNQTLLDTREEEHEALSLILPDELRDSMTDLKADLDWVRAHLNQPEHCEKKIDIMVAITNDVINKAQHISSKIQPLNLENLPRDKTIS